MRTSGVRVQELEYISQVISSKDDGRAVKAARPNPSDERMDGRKVPYMHTSTFTRCEILTRI